MSIDVSVIYRRTLEHFNRAFNNINSEKRVFEHNAEAISM